MLDAKWNKQEMKPTAVDPYPRELISSSLRFQLLFKRQAELYLCFSVVDVQGLALVERDSCIDFISCGPAT